MLPHSCIAIPRWKIADCHTDTVVLFQTTPTVLTLLLVKRSMEPGGTGTRTPMTAKVSRDLWLSICKCCTNFLFMFKSLFSGLDSTSFVFIVKRLQCQIPTQEPCVQVWASAMYIVVVPVNFARAATACSTAICFKKLIGRCFLCSCGVCTVFLIGLRDYSGVISCTRER